MPSADQVDATSRSDMDFAPNQVNMPPHVVVATDVHNNTMDSHEEMQSRAPFTQLETTNQVKVTKASSKVVVIPKDRITLTDELLAVKIDDQSLLRNGHQQIDGS